MNDFVCTKTRNSSVFSQFSWGLLLHYSRRFYEVYITTVRANVDDFFLGSLKSGGTSANAKLRDPELKNKHAGWEKSWHEVVLH